jgi:hypothetical protein
MLPYDTGGWKMTSLSVISCVCATRLFLMNDKSNSFVAKQNMNATFKDAANALTRLYKESLASTKNVSLI